MTTSKGGGWRMWAFHWLALRLMGAQPVRLMAPLDRGTLPEIDGFIIGGGDDIAAELYGAVAGVAARIDPARDLMELSILAHACPKGVPVLGVCRGAQMLNVHLGGSLHQDVRKAYAGAPKMWTPLPRRRVDVEDGSRLAGIIGPEAVDVNSLHTQSVDRLGRGLVVSGRDEWGVVQAVEDPEARFRIGVQWHPEFLTWRRRHRALFRAFVKAVEEGMTA